MILLADEGVDRQIMVKLRAEGHVVTYIAEMEPGISDEMVLFRAREAGAVLITEDKDFGDLVFRQGLVTNGVVLLRLAGFPSEEKATRVARS